MWKQPRYLCSWHSLSPATPYSLPVEVPYSPHTSKQLYFFVKCRTNEKFTPHSLHLLLDAPTISVCSPGTATSHAPFSDVFASWSSISMHCSSSLAHTYTVLHFPLSCPPAVKVIVAGWLPLNPDIPWSPLPASFSFIHAQLSLNSTIPPGPFCQSPVLCYQFQLCSFRFWRV